MATGSVYTSNAQLFVNTCIQYVYKWSPLGRPTVAVIRIEVAAKTHAIEETYMRTVSLAVL